MKPILDIDKSIIEIKLNKKELKKMVSKITNCKNPKISISIYDKKQKSVRLKNNIKKDATKGRKEKK